jgi:hypothetical protein
MLLMLPSCGVASPSLPGELECLHLPMENVIRCASRYTSSPAARQSHEFKKSRNKRMALRDPTAILVLLQTQEVTDVSE